MYDISKPHPSFSQMIKPKRSSYSNADIHHPAHESAFMQPTLTLIMNKLEKQ